MYIKIFPRLCTTISTLFFFLFIHAQDELFQFKDTSGKIGFKNKSGTVIIAPKYDNVKLFYKGYAPVSLNKKWGIINQKGIEIVPVKYDELDYTFIRNFEKGPLRARIGEKWGFVNSKGKEVVPLKYDMVNGFSDGFAWVILNSKAGFVNASGKEIVAPKYEWPDFGPYDEIEFDYYFFEGMAAFYSKGKFGFVDISGKEIVPAKYEDVEWFTNGFAAVMINKLWGFINKSGKEIVSPKYSTVREFAGGLAAVSLNNKWGFINRSGKEIAPLKYSSIRDASEGLAAVAIDGKWGFIDSTGKEVIPLQFNYVRTPFKNGKAHVDDVNNKMIIIDKTGKPVGATTKVPAKNNNNLTNKPSNSDSVKNKPVPPPTNNNAKVVLKGSIDPSLAGTWKFYDPKMDMSNYYVFRSDGTFDYYPGFVAANNSLASKNCTWRVDGNFIEMACPGNEKAQRLSFQKKNDPVTKKAALFIEFKAAITTNRMYIAVENKDPWK